MPTGIYKRNMLGEKNPNWKGGKLIKKNGYIIIHCPYHPYASKDKYVLEHRLVMEKEIKRFLLRSEIVHHVNGNVSDNRIENLMILDQKEHARFHMKLENKRRKPCLTATT